jgi:hypothetical protein
VGMVGLLRLIAGMEYLNAATERVVRPTSRCYIEADTDAEIVDTLLRGLAKERVG